MDDREPRPKSYSFTRRKNTRQIRPNDDESDTLSVTSVDPSPNTQSPSTVQLLQTNKISPKQNIVSLDANKSSTPITPTKGLLIAGGIFLGISLLIVIPTVLAVMLTRVITVIGTTTTTTIAPIGSTVYWGFDQTSNDLNGTYNGTLLNGADYTNNTYFGYGFNLILNNSVNSSFTVSSPFLNLSYTSFTVEAWIYGYSLTGDNGVFSQCQCSTCQDQCLYFIIRNYKMYMGFMLDDVIGITSLTANTWYHVAYVYDYSNQSQSVYLQGVLDATKTSSGPYQGQNGSTVIGSSYLSSSSFNGLIDNVKVTTRAKSASELLTDGSLVAYFSFDGTTLTQDEGPNLMNGSLSNAAAVSGKVGQALAFSGTASSYFQAYGFFQLGQSNKAFSFSMWINPYSINGGILIQKTTLQYSSGTWCYGLMGLTYLGQIIMIVYTTNVPLIIGPILSVRTWTHLGFTYSQTHGLRMYINGVLFGTTGAISWSSSSTIDWLSFGSNLGNFCGPSVLYNTPFLGAVDEIYIYRRELAASEILAFANP